MAVGNAHGPQPSPPCSPNLPRCPSFPPSPAATIFKASYGCQEPHFDVCFLQNWERNPAAITDFSPTRKSLPAFMSMCHTGEKHHRCPLILELMCCASRSHGKMRALQLNPTEMGRIKGDHASGGVCGERRAQVRFALTTSDWAGTDSKCMAIPTHKLRSREQNLSSAQRLPFSPKLIINPKLAIN